jgi:prepilin-type N-terminal cleavage/methylation domain-containing protein
VGANSRKLAWEGTAMLQASMRRHRDREGGFTLVELLVVIVILGVLAGIVVFAVGGVSQKSKASACNTDIDSVQTAEEVYFTQNGAYTASIPALVTAKLLRAVPLTTNGYVISADSTGLVTSAPLCSTL